MDNLDEFNRITAGVFADCYADFPVKKHLSAEDVLPEPNHHQRWLFELTMEWLVQYGWLSAEKDKERQFFKNVQLTEKALVALDWLPETLPVKANEPLGRRMADAFAQGAVAEAGRLVIDALKAGMS